MSVSRKSLISSLLAGGLLLSLIGASPANAAPAVALSINGVAITTASASTTPASVTVPADNSVDAVDAVRFFLTSVDAGTTVTVAATNSFIVSSLSTTLNPVKNTAGVTSASYNVGTGTTSKRRTASAVRRDTRSFSAGDFNPTPEIHSRSAPA